MVSTQAVGTYLLYLAVPGANLFPLAYGLTARWWEFRVGRAILVSKVGLLLLVDAAFLFRVRGGVDYPLHDELLVFAFGLITLGTYMYAWALLVDHLIPRWHAHRGQDTPEPDSLLDDPGPGL